jgi:hypothetical protein
MRKVQSVQVRFRSICFTAISFGASLFGAGCGDGGGNASRPDPDEDSDPRKKGYLVEYLYDNFIAVDRDFFDKIAQRYLTTKKTDTGTISPLEVAYTYDEQNRITLETKTMSGTTNTLTYTYGDEWLTEMRETVSGAADTVITPTIDADGALTAYSKTYFGNTTTRTLKFDASGRLTGADVQSTLDEGNGGGIFLIYDGNGLLTTVETRTSGGVVMDQLRIALDPNFSNRITEIAEYAHGSMHIKTLRFSYDATTEFIASADVLTGAPPAATGSMTFSFDGEGRPTALDEVGSTGELAHSIRYTY